MEHTLQNPHRTKIAVWLFFTAFLVFMMVVVGGLTRLTESGLSMTKWHPVKQIIPPLNDAEWEAEFGHYKESPEYQKKNFGMDIEDFKKIFYWEWAHRLLGKIVGIVFLFPFLYFVFTRKIKKNEVPKFIGLFLLGGFQGLIGWWMVKSGLVDSPDVSHFRLAAHLGLALIIFSLLLYTAFSYYLEPQRIKNTSLNYFVFFVYISLFGQIVFGALLAGLDGGVVYNTWPNMNENFIAPEAFNNGFVAGLSDAVSIQVLHRWWAFMVLALVFTLFLKVKGIIYDLSEEAKTLRRFRIASKGLLHGSLTQIVLGILTLVNQVPIPLASLHQIIAVVLLGFTTYFIRVSRW